MSFAKKHPQVYAYHTRPPQQQKPHVPISLQQRQNFSTSQQTKLSTSRPSDLQVNNLTIMGTTQAQKKINVLGGNSVILGSAQDFNAGKRSNAYVFGTVDVNKNVILDGATGNTTIKGTLLCQNSIKTLTGFLYGQKTTQGFLQFSYDKIINPEDMPFALFFIKVPTYATNTAVAPQQSFTCKTTIIYLADILDSKQSFLGCGFYKIKFLFIVYQDNFYVVPVASNYCGFSTATSQNIKLIRFLQPMYDRVSKTIGVFIYNAQGTDFMDGKNFQPQGTLKNQFIHLKIITNADQNNFSISQQ
jgi:hypothetical protein